VQNALTMAQQGLAADPENRTLLQAVGAIQVAAGNYSLALDSFAKLAALQPESPIPQALIAFAYVKAGDGQRALDALDRALKIKPDFFSAQLAAARLHYQLGNKEAAMRMARDIQREHPKAPDGYLIEADVLRSDKRWAEADRALKNGLDHASGSTVAVKRHSVLLESGQVQRAKEFANEWLAANPKDVGFRTYLAQRALAAGDYSEASKQYQAALSLTPSDALLLNNLAWTAQQMKDPKALEYAERANKLRPNTPAILDTLGWILVEGGQVPRGLALLQEAVERAPTTLPIRLNLAKALMRAGQKDAAKKELDYLSANIKDERTKAEVDALVKQL
jgi:putative PEP-CTERM system TPR-repeat lipoprotein